MKCIEVLDGNQIEAVEMLAREIWTEHYTAIIGRDAYKMEKDVR